MNEKQKALQLLLENKLFASSPTALAQELEYGSNDTYYKLSQGKGSAATAEHTWQLLQSHFGYNEDDLYASAQIARQARKLKKRLAQELEETAPATPEEILQRLTDEAYGSFSPRFNKDTIPLLKDLRRKSPGIFWGTLALCYLWAKGINPKRKKFSQTFHRYLTDLDDLLAGLYPENDKARRAADNLKTLALQGFGSPNYQTLIYHGVLMFRYYTEPNFDQTAAQGMQLFNWPPQSYWICPDTPYRPDTEVWLLVERNFDTADNGLYIALSLMTGRDTETFTAQSVTLLSFWAQDREDDPPVLQAMRQQGTDRTRRPHLSDPAPPPRLLTLTPNPETGNLFGLPERLYQLNLEQPQGKDEKVWARILRKFNKQQAESLFRQMAAQCLGIRLPDEDYTVEDVIVSRRALTLLVNRTGTHCTYTLPADAYAFIGKITPAHTVIITRHEATGTLWVEWPQAGYSLPLSDFTEQATED